MTNTFPRFPEHISVPKAQAKRFATALTDRVQLSHAQSLEIIAKVHGQQSWGHMRSILESGEAPISAPPPSSGPDLVLHDVLLRDLIRVMMYEDGDDMWAWRTAKALQESWPGLAGTPDIDMPATVRRDALLDAVTSALAAETEKTRPLLIDKVARAAAQLHALISTPPRSWQGSSGMEDKLIIDGFQQRDDRQITWPDAVSSCRHAVLYTDDFDAMLQQMLQSGLHVHDLAQRKDWTRLVSMFGGPTQSYALGTTGMYQLLGHWTERELKHNRSGRTSRPVQIVILSLRECLVMNPDILLAQARASRVQILVHWDIGAFPSITTRTQRNNLTAVFRNTARSLVHISEEGLWRHRD